jgi:hypothetical protein
LRSTLAGGLVACALVFAPNFRADAVPGFCPPICDAIPDSAWIAPTSIPLYDVYRWPGLAGLAVNAHPRRFAFEELCASPPVASDARNYAVAARASAGNPEGQWQLQAQLIHWRGDTATGGPTVTSILEQARSRLYACQATVPTASPSITTNDRDRIAAVISVAGRRVMRQYLLASPDSSTVVELALWSALPPQVPWPAVADAVVLAALASPLCSAYLGSCR